MNKKGCGKFLFKEEFKDKNDLFNHEIHCGDKLIVNDKLQLCKECKKIQQKVGEKEKNGR
jgi:hypothetical protein